MPVGTWVGTIKVDNEKIWELAKVDGVIRGFSIEGFFSDRAERPKEQIEENLNKEIEAGLELLQIKKALIEDELKKINLETYNDYPQGAVNNAKRCLEWVEKNGWGGCGTDVGKRRANQIAKKQKIK